MFTLKWFGRRSGQTSVVTLGMWGPPASGKTMLIAMINSYCESYDWDIRPATSETADYMERVTYRLFERGELPGPTPPTTPVLYRFSLISRTGWRRREAILELPDPSGEICSQPEHRVFNMIEYLNRCQGILWLLDPIALEKHQLYGTRDTQRSYRQMIYRTLSRMFQTQYQSRGYIDKYMAFVLTKMDHPDHSRYFDSPKEYALSLLGRHFERMIESFCVTKRVNYFSTSALGFADSERTVSNLDESDPDRPTLHTRDISPIGILDPFDWMLRRLL